MLTPKKSKGSDPPAGRIAAARLEQLGDPTRRMLRDRLGASSAALAFAEAVTLQLARASVARAGAADAERLIARRVLELLAEPLGTDKPALLAADAELLSSFFQNVDLLYQNGFAGADAVSTLIMSALEVAERP